MNKVQQSFKPTGATYSNFVFDFGAILKNVTKNQWEDGKMLKLREVNGMRMLKMWVSKGGKKMPMFLRH
jgi:hypothetical protein